MYEKTVESVRVHIPVHEKEMPRLVECKVCKALVWGTDENLWEQNINSSKQNIPLVAKFNLLATDFFFKF